MECPIPCYLCGDITPLDSLHFFTTICDCQGRSTGCTHGICDGCFYLEEELGTGEPVVAAEDATNQGVVRSNPFQENV
jgi:hypothetical protein